MHGHLATLFFATFAIGSAGCVMPLPTTIAEASTSNLESTVTTYRQDLTFLQEHGDVLELENPEDGTRLCFVPAWQGRVMTSSTSIDGLSYGWLNYQHIKKGVQPADRRRGLAKHIHAFGGEERFWIGPEGGQFSSFFAPGTEFLFENWIVPSFIDTESWTMVSNSKMRARLQHRVTVTNWSGYAWGLLVEREINLLAKHEIEKNLAMGLPETIKGVAFETINTITNDGAQAWDETTGMPSIWILGMMKHGPETTVVIPFETHGQNLGPAVTDEYFGKVPPNRLIINEKKGVLYFSADGMYRSKIGVSPKRSKGIAGSWDAVNRVLTIVEYKRPPDEQSRYVNSQWTVQKDPFGGDAINSYNDGPIDGDQLGPFYEIETSSPALGLAPGESYTHVQRTIHLEGPIAKLNRFSVHIFGVNLATIEAAIQ